MRAVAGPLRPHLGLEMSVSSLLDGPVIRPSPTSQATAFLRMPVPVLAVGDDGTILFANAAFSQMLGHAAEAVQSLTFAQIFAGQPADTSPVMFIRAHAHQLVELVHRDGSTVRATMSPSALLRAGDSVALASFHDRTEELWLQDR
jgi:PAS domain S-box-containing protein